MGTLFVGGLGAGDAAIEIGQFKFKLLEPVREDNDRFYFDVSTYVSGDFIGYAIRCAQGAGTGLSAGALESDFELFPIYFRAGDSIALSDGVVTALYRDFQGTSDNYFSSNASLFRVAPVTYDPATCCLGIYKRIGDTVRNNIHAALYIAAEIKDIT